MWITLHVAISLSHNDVGGASLPRSFSLSSFLIFYSLSACSTSQTLFCCLTLVSTSLRVAGFSQASKTRITEELDSNYDSDSALAVRALRFLS